MPAIDLRFSWVFPFCISSKMRWIYLWRSNMFESNCRFELTVSLVLVCRQPGIWGERRFWVVGYQSKAVAEWLLSARMLHLSDCGQFGAHIPLQLNYIPVNLTSNRLLWEFWLSFFYSQGSLAIKHSLTIKKPAAYRIPQRFEGIFTWPVYVCLAFHPMSG